MAKEISNVSLTVRAAISPQKQPFAQLKLTILPYDLFSSLRSATERLIRGDEDL